MCHYISSSTNDHSCVRSLFSSDPNCLDSRDKWKWFTKNFKLVRVLDIEAKNCYEVPSNLGNFIHLRYLRINSKFIRSIPDSICNLQNLQTLNIGSLPGSHMISCPIGISKLKQLRHVYTVGPIILRGCCIKSNGDVMWNLQTISHIILNEETTYLIENGSFPKLRKLGLHIINFKGDVLKALLRLQQLKHLNKLKIKFGLKSRTERRWDINYKPEEVLECLNYLSHLSILKIFNAFELVTCGAMFPPNITELKLTNITCLNDDGMNTIGNLTKLQILILIGDWRWLSAFDLNCAEDGFPQLQEFHMKSLPIRSWKLGNGSMTRLHTLDIDRCIQLDGLPSELWSLTTLAKVRLPRYFNSMAAILRNLEVKNGCELIIE